MTLLTAIIGAFEALLFAMLGRVVDWLGRLSRTGCGPTSGAACSLLAGLLIGSVALVMLQTLFKHQALAANFPMRLRWNFHRLMLGQSMGFYQDEFAGRIATKVMQTALAVRDTWMIAGDILVFVTIYFVTIVAVVGTFNAWMLVPFIGWAACYVMALRFFVPRLSRVARDQADARSLMTGRITDAYTNIATVKLFSHAGREADYGARRDAGVHGAGLSADAAGERLRGDQPRAQHAAHSRHGRCRAVAVDRWAGGVGALAAATAMALRLNGISHWVMWEMASLFEHVGTVQDGINTLARPRMVVDREGARPLSVPRGRFASRM